MGKKAQILLVAVLLLLRGAKLPDAEHIVAASAGGEFWLWAGVHPQPALRSAHTVYLHQGEVTALACPQRACFRALGIPVAKLTVPNLWLTLRIETLDLPPDTLKRVAVLMEHWRRAGNHVVGLQLDFDAATRSLGEYDHFLRQVRDGLDSRYRLSVTGLLDWAQNGSVQTLNQLPVDELVIQTYQGRQTVTKYARYLPALMALRVPFKLGLVQGGVWNDDWERRLSRSAYYRGRVVFMVNAPRRANAGSG